MLNNSHTNVYNVVNDVPYVAVNSGDNTFGIGDDIESKIFCVIQEPKTAEIGEGTENQSMFELVDIFTSTNKETIIQSDAIVTGKLSQNQFQLTSSDANGSPQPVAEKANSQVTYKYMCIKCGDNFSSSNEYQDHLKSHKYQKKFECSECSAGYNVENNLKIHMILDHSKDEGRSCPICNVTLTHQRAAGMKSHLMVHHVEELHVCDKCRAEFEKEDEYVKHMQSHELEYKTIQPFTCSHCKVHFENRIEYRSHIAEHQRAKSLFTKTRKTSKSSPPKTKKFPCSVCDRTFIKLSLLERHERIHTGEKPFKCEKCDQSFTQKGTLKTHYNKHDGTKPFVCTMCPAKFNQKGNLKVHIRKTHTFPEKGDKMYKCSHCTCIFKKVASLNGHVTRVHSKTDDPENVIMEVMKNLKEMDKQMNKKNDSASIQEGSKTQKSFHSENKARIQKDDSQTKSATQSRSSVTLLESANDGSVRKHVVQHKRVGDIHWYCCEYCPKQCKKPSDLIRHLRMHTKEKPYECTQCNMAFTLKYTLLSHMKTHNTSGSYKCNKCDSVFGSSRNLNAHMRKHELEISKWLCSLCMCTFGDLEKALMHKKEKGPSHAMEPEINTVWKQPLHQTIHENITFKQRKPRVGSTGADLSSTRFSKKVNLNRHQRNHTNESHLYSKTFVTAYRSKDQLYYRNDNKKFVCKVCNKRFVSSTLLKKHMIVHNTNKPYICPYCSKRFKTLLLSKHHIHEVHKKEDLPKIVGNGTIDFNASGDNSTRVATNHVPSNEDDTSIEQVNPDSFFTRNETPSNSILDDVVNPGDLLIQNDDHEAVYMTLEELERLENSNFVLDPSLNTNMKIFNTDNLTASNFIPDGANVVLVNSYADLVNATVRKQIGEENVLSYEGGVQTINNVAVKESSAIFDGNTVVQTSDLNETRNIFEDSRIICMNCNGLFSSFISFQKHKCTQKNTNIVADNDKLEHVSNQEVKEDREGPKQYICHICQEELPNNFFLNKHLKHHHSEQTKYECRKCNTFFYGKIEYLEHMSFHKTTPHQGHPCIFCIKVFKKASDLNRHLRVHTGEKPFHCNICDKSFSLKSTLLSHVRTHDHKSKEFNCNICNSFYASKSSLKVHMSVHTGQKPFPCTFCKMKFRTSANKKSHEVLMHLSKKNRGKANSKNKITDVLESVASQMVINCPCNDESTTGQSTENIHVRNDNSTEQKQQLDSSTQIINFNVAPEGMLTIIPEEQITIDPSLLLPQIQMSDIVLATNDNNELNNSFILNEVNLLDINPASNNIQIISLSQDEEKTVTIGTGETEIKPEKPKNVQCDICNKMYSSKDVLRRHKKNVHGEKLDLSCPECNKNFKSKITFLRHCKSHPELTLSSSAEGAINVTGEVSEAATERENKPVDAMDSSSSLLKFDLPIVTIEDPLFNTLFSIKKV